VTRGRRPTAQELLVRDEITTLLGWQQDGGPFALATVIDTSRSAPRPAGAVLAVHPDGRIAGNVSGGCVEPAVVGLCQAVLAEAVEAELEQLAEQVASEAGSGETKSESETQEEEESEDLEGEMLAEQLMDTVKLQMAFQKSMKEFPSKTKSK
jgi:hypothetical protein